MAKIAEKPRSNRDGIASIERKIKSSLQESLKTSGIQAKIMIQPLPHTKLLRVMVTSPNFVEMWMSERQDLVWRIVSGALSHDEQLRVSMIVTLTPHEVVGKWPLRDHKG
jgi:hypothetical protein